MMPGQRFTPFLFTNAGRTDGIPKAVDLKSLREELQETKPDYTDPEVSNVNGTTWEVRTEGGGGGKGSGSVISIR